MIADWLHSRHVKQAEAGTHDSPKRLILSSEVVFRPLLVMLAFDVGGAVSVPRSAPDLVASV